MAFSAKGDRLWWLDVQHPAPISGAFFLGSGRSPWIGLLTTCVLLSGYFLTPMSGLSHTWMPWRDDFGLSAQNHHWVTAWRMLAWDISKNKGWQCLDTLSLTDLFQEPMLMFSVEISSVHAFILISHRLKAFGNRSWTGVPRRLIHLAVSWTSCK